MTNIDNSLTAVDPLCIKNTARCLYATDKLTTHQAYENLKYTHTHVITLWKFVWYNEHH
jgi:hypothetical protein